jgi:hypothetical protein
VTFGDPESRLIRLTEDSFKEGLNDEIQQLMKRFDFYSLVISVDPKPQPNVVISKLECQLDFRPQGDPQPNAPQPIVHSIIPNSKWQTLVNAGITLNMGLDANLDVGVGVDASEFTKIANLPDYDKFKANVSTKDEFKGFIALHGLNYKLGKFNIFAQGEDNSQCYWRIEKVEIQGQSTVKFGIILKVPQGWESVDLIGNVWIEPNIDWWTGEFTNVIKNGVLQLTDNLKNLFGSKKKAAESFAVGTKTTWKLTLPKP